MKVGDLITVAPHGMPGQYLIVGEDPERENNKAEYPHASELGRLFFIYEGSTGKIKEMYERWIEVIDEQNGEERSHACGQPADSTNVSPQ
jgi:hypothetical protein